MHPATRIIAVLFSSLIVSSCFSTSRRISFGGEGTKEVPVELGSGDIRFATYFMARNTFGAVARYEIELLQAGRVVSRTTCEVLPVIDDRQCRHHYTEMRECTIVMQCRAHLEAGGPTTVRARLSIPKKPEGFKLDRIDLSVGQ